MKTSIKKSTYTEQLKEISDYRRHFQWQRRKKLKKQTTYILKKFRMGNKAGGQEYWKKEERKCRMYEKKKTFFRNANYHKTDRTEKVK